MTLLSCCFVLSCRWLSRTATSNVMGDAIVKIDFPFSTWCPLLVVHRSFFNNSAASKLTSSDSRLAQAHRPLHRQAWPAWACHSLCALALLYDARPSAFTCSLVFILSTIYTHPLSTTSPQPSSPLSSRTAGSSTEQTYLAYPQYYKPLFSISIQREACWSGWTDR